MRETLLCTMLLAGCLGGSDTFDTDQEAFGIPPRPRLGEETQGTSLEGQLPDSLAGIDYAGAGLGSSSVTGLHVQRGELVGLRDGLTVVRGAQLVGLHLTAHSPSEGVVPLRVTSAERGTVVPSTHPEWVVDASGDTWVYLVERYSRKTGAWTPLCAPNIEGRIEAVPVAALWNGRGDRVESVREFTFSCLKGVIAKCIRWGYRPWISSNDPQHPMTEIHQACTRAARADYCGDGLSHTVDDTPINIFDTLAPHVEVDDSNYLISPMLFEAGWSPDGAYCLSHLRWANFPPTTCSPNAKRGPYEVLNFAGTTGRFARECNRADFDPSVNSYPMVKILLESKINQLP